MENSDNPNMDRFYQRMRSDLMYELRNIQHGERPVTGQNHRQQLQDFIRKNVKTTETSNGKNVDDAAENTEQHRPESIVFEIQGIVEQRPVSSVLQSAGLRHRLENIISDSLGRLNPAPRNGTHIRTATPSPRPRVVVANRDRPSPPVTTISEISDHLSLSRHDSVDSLASEQSFSSAVSEIEEAFSDEEDERIEAVVPPRPSPRPAPRNVSATSPVESQQERQPRESVRESSPWESPVEPQNLIQEADWNDITGVHRQELIEEISELLHSRLVSSTLDGGFRATLELHMQNRASSSGLDGNAVRNFISTLPRTGHQRNDFSDLGIQSGLDDNFDNISVTSVSAHSVPYNQTNTYLSKEIHQLKGQMAELKNMLKMSIDIQMEVQRSIRQEVAAAVAQGACGGTESALNPSRSQPLNDTHCLICLDKFSDSVLYQCGHMCVCYFCGRDLMSRNHNCPVCRAPIKDVIRAYKTNVE